MNRLLKAVAIISLLAWGGIAFAQSNATSTSTPQAGNASAMSKVTFPVVELGNCDSQEACKLYCDQVSHRDACFAFALRVGLMAKEKVDAAKIILAKKGPGSCDSRESCAAYCANSANADECLSFAKEHKIISDDQATLIQKLTRGEAPGACKSADTCRAYCSDSSHADECRAFAQNNGLAPKMGSSTLPIKMPPRTGSSTEPMRGAEGMPSLNLRPGSTTVPTPGIKGSERPNPAAAGSSTSSAKPPLPPKPQSGTPMPEKSNLGASVIEAFAHLLGL